MTEKAVERRLENGETLTLGISVPPLERHAAAVGAWPAIRSDLVSGNLAQRLYTPHFIGEISGQFAGSMSYYTPTDTKDVGVVEFVQTRENHRRKGVASALMKLLTERFTADGGTALYLCTTNPIAGKLYERHGFRYCVGDGMRHVVGDASGFDETYFSHQGKAYTRAAHWGDLPRAAVLFNHPEPGWFIKEYITKCFRNTRFESHFVTLMKKAEERQGIVVVLENPIKRVVGLAAVVRENTYYEQHIATLSLRVHPTYADQSAELFQTVRAEAQEIGISELVTHVAECDTDAIALFERLGFSEQARLRGHLRSENRLMDIAVYGTRLGELRPPLREISQYYGERQEWQTERIRSSTDRARSATS